MSLIDSIALSAVIMNFLTFKKMWMDEVREVREYLNWEIHIIIHSPTLDLNISFLRVKAGFLKIKIRLKMNSPNSFFFLLGWMYCSRSKQGFEAASQLRIFSTTTTVGTAGYITTSSTVGETSAFFHSSQGEYYCKQGMGKRKEDERTPSMKHPLLKTSTVRYDG